MRLATVFGLLCSPLSYVLAQESSQSIFPNSKLLPVVNATENYYLAEQQYRWKDDEPDLEIFQSNKTIIQLKDSNQRVESQFEFWTKRMDREIEKLESDLKITNSFYEFLTICRINNVDVTDFTPDTVIQCRVGFHQERNVIDWLVVDVKYPGPGETTDLSTWSCVDGFLSKELEEDEVQQIMVDEQQNCYLNTDSAKSSIVTWPENDEQAVSGRRLQQDETEDQPQDDVTDDASTDTTEDTTTTTSDETAVDSASTDSSTTDSTTTDSTTTDSGTPAEEAPVNDAPQQNNGNNNQRTYANITVQFMRPFSTVNEDESDISFIKRRNIGLQLALEYGQSLRTSGTTLYLEDPGVLNFANKLKLGALSTIALILYNL